MNDQETTGDTPAADDDTPRVHPEEPAEGAEEGHHESEEPSVPRWHAQDPAEGPQEPGEPR
jgi:hypothetical protein